MGRQPEPHIPDDTVPAVSEGALTPSAWAALVLARVNRADTGTLLAKSGNVERTFRFIRGIPVNATSSDAAEDFTETLVGATRSMVRATLAISGAAVTIEPSTLRSSPTFSARRRFSLSI